MRRGRIPLTALRSFEAAGRLLSFGKAAEELFVSQAAISRQVRELEILLGKSLFVRRHRGVDLTVEGKLLLDRVTASFGELERAVSDIRSAPTQRRVRLSVEPSFASEWLNPRLGRFAQLRSDIDLSVEAELRLNQFRPDEPELAVRFGAEARSWPHTQALHLFDLHLTPALAPDLFAAGPPIEKPADLERFVLIHDYDRTQWRKWLAAAGLTELTAQRGTIFADAGHGMQAARLGHGVVLSDPIMDADDFRLGRLVRPLATTVAHGAYWLVASDFERLSEHAAAFVDWFLREMAEARSDAEASATAAVG
jgi:LysR family glycine cleavage system transcriptional activator